MYTPHLLTSAACRSHLLFALPPQGAINFGLLRGDPRVPLPVELEEKLQVGCWCCRRLAWFSGTSLHCC